VGKMEKVRWRIDLASSEHGEGGGGWPTMARGAVVLRSVVGGSAA
jgi:hypothetical protein